MKPRVSITILIFGVLLGLILSSLLSKGEKNITEAEVSHTMIVEKIESLGDLEVLKYNIQDIIEYKKIRQWLPNAKAALLISGEVICCVNLAKIKPDDIYTSVDSIRLQLPSPEICHVKIDHSKSRVYNIEYGLWESVDIVDAAYKSAEKQLIEKSLELDIKQKGRDNTVILLKPILEAMGFKHILITFDSYKTGLKDQ